MTGALVLTLPGLLCGVMAWDLSRPSKPCPADAPARPSRTSRAVVALLAGCGTAALSAAWLPISAGSVVLAGVVAAAITSVGFTGRRSRPSPPLAAASPGGLAAVPAELA